MAKQDVFRVTLISYSPLSIPRFNFVMFFLPCTEIFIIPFILFRAARFWKDNHRLECKNPAVISLLKLQTYDGGRFSLLSWAAVSTSLWLTADYWSKTQKSDRQTVKVTPLVNFRKIWSFWSVFFLFSKWTSDLENPFFFTYTRNFISMPQFISPTFVTEICRCKKDLFKFLNHWKKTHPETC